MTLLDIQNLSLQLSGAQLLNELNLQLNAGEVVAIIGPNGAGKTSLLRSISGDIPEITGQINFNGQTLSSYTAKQRATRLAVLPQHNTLAFPFLAQDVVGLGRLPHATGKLVDADIVKATLAAMDITYLAQRSYPSLSGGEKQRVQLARVMAQVWRSEDAAERLLLLDEPTAALDIGHCQQLMQCIRRFARGGAGVIMVVHDFNLAATYADRIIALACGHVAVQGTPEEVLTRSTMRETFGVNATIIGNPKTGRPMVCIDD